MLKQASRTSLAESAAEAMRREIASGRWAIGARIPIEPKLADMLGVSRGTVREAVRILVSQGLLAVRQGSGTSVRASFDPAASLVRMKRTGLRDQFEVRCALEVEAARLAATRHAAEDILLLDRLLDQRGSQRDAGGVEAFVARDVAFHVALVRASRNLALIETYAFFTEAVQETIRSTLDNGMPEPSLASHRAIVRAIAAGDPERAAATVRAFIAPILTELDRLLASSEPARTAP